jgi:hypothetical protein
MRIIKKYPNSIARIMKKDFLGEKGDWSKGLSDYCLNSYDVI